MPHRPYPSTNLRLLEATWAGDEAAVERALSQGARVNVRSRQPSSRGQAPVHRLFANAGIEPESLVACVNHLLAAGADLNLSDAEGRTPAMLLLSVQNDHHIHQVLPRLLEHGLRLDGAPSTFPPPVFLAGPNAENPDLLGLVLAHGGHLEQRNAQQDTPLLAHVRSIHMGLRTTRWADVLLDRGAEVNAVSGLDRGSALTMLVQTLERHPGNATALCRLLERGANPAHAQRLLVPGSFGGCLSHLGPDPEYQNRPVGDGYTALHFAAWYGSLAACEALLAHGAPLTAPTSNRGLPLRAGGYDRFVQEGPGFTPRDLALIAGHEHVARLLEGAELRAEIRSPVEIARPRPRL